MSRLGRIERAAVGLLLTLGFVSRLVPILEGGRRLLTQFPSEDGYLMLTIARNIAAGLGMSIAQGQLPTNGTQPLATLLYAGGFALVGGDREAGVRLALVLDLVLASLTVLAMVRLGKTVLADRPWASLASWLGAALWYASPMALPISMNCQETVLYVLLVLLACQAWLGLREVHGLRGALFPGLLLGVAFWARNDAVFVVASVAAAHLAVGGDGGRSAWRGRAMQAVVMGGAALLMAVPWLVYNYLGFGSIMPISGYSQSLGVPLGHGMSRLPAVLGQLMLPFAGIRAPREVWLPYQLLFGAVTVIGLFHYARMAARTAGAERKLLTFGWILLALLVAYYGLFFGAPYFLRRYLFPLSPLLALGAGAALAAGLASLPATRRRVLAAVGGTAIVALVAAQNLALYGRGEHHGHWEKATWAREHVPEEAWIGAIQSGTLGFFHDRTINLDGKVNPEAMIARKQGRLAAYVVNSPIEWLIDWPLIHRLAQRPAVKRSFELVLDDRQRKLVVLRRRSGAPRADIVEPVPAASP